MKNFTKLIIIAALLVVTIATCNKDVTEIQLNKTTLFLDIGDTEMLTVTVLPESAAKSLIWKSSNNNVAIVNQGEVTAKATGTATITVTTKDGDKKATCALTVKHPGESEMILVEEGRFTMGCTDNACFEGGREEPAHQVNISSFKIGKYPVTQKQWKAIMNNNPSYFYGDDLPVEQVSWFDVQEFITKLNAATGKNYRLATEAEWEYAARGGKDSKEYKYSGSNDVDAVAWHNLNSNNKTHPVGTKAPNELGLYDMSGNVWEWCSDWYGAYTDTLQTNPTGPETGYYRVARGGGWSYAQQYCRVSSRRDVSPGIRHGHLGFRLVLQ